MRFTLGFLILLTPGIAWADDKADAQAALELSLALNKNKVVTKPKLSDVNHDLALAKWLSKETGKAILIRSGDCDCSELCDAVKDEMIRVHTNEKDSKLPKGLHLALPDGKDGFWWIKQWDSVPSEKEVREMEKFGRDWIKEQRKLKPQKLSSTTHPQSFQAENCVTVNGQKV
jgi:hypothetical protein